MRKEYDFSRGKRGAVIPSPGKTRITIMLDDDVIETFRARAEAAGRGYQTLINEALRTSLKGDDRPLTAKVMREIVREASAYSLKRAARVRVTGTSRSYRKLRLSAPRLTSERRYKAAEQQREHITPPSVCASRPPTLTAECIGSRSTISEAPRRTRNHRLFTAEI